MGSDARLNLLLTPLPPRAGQESQPQPWYKTLARLLEPLGVRTFQASSGSEAVELIEKIPIHLAVVDARLPTISGLNVLQLIQKLRENANPSPPADSHSPPPMQLNFHMEVHEGPVGENPHARQRRIEVRFDARPAIKPGPGPAVILIAPPPPQQDRQLMQDALKFNAFSVLSEPVDVNLALEVMARALKRFHHNQWPA